MSAAQFPLLEGKASGKHCTNCSAKMTAYMLPGHYNASVEIDVCMDCNAIWFDQFESMALSPDGTVALFQLIHQRGGTATSAATKFGEGLRCVTCGDGMRLTNDAVKNTRFTYQACRNGHGRLTTFYNFLAEKQFVRELTKTERAKLAAKIEQIRCSGCGAAVNIGKVDACEYCRAPVSVFDRDAAKKAIDHYLQERRKQPVVAAGDRRTTGRASGDHWSAYDRADLGGDILFALGRAALRGVSGAGRAVPAGVAAGVTSGAFADAGDVVSSIISGATGGAMESAGSALPSATDALFDAASSVASDIGGGAINAVSAGALDIAGNMAGDVAGDMASEVASSASDGIVDLVTDGIGSLLGSLFS